MTWRRGISGYHGASGSGKTTLLNCISAIDTAGAGKILLDGVNVTELSETELAKFRRERLGSIHASEFPFLLPFVNGEAGFWENVFCIHSASEKICFNRFRKKEHHVFPVVKSIILWGRLLTNFMAI